MMSFSQYRAAFVFINRKPSEKKDYDFIRQEIKKIPGVIIVHLSIRKPEIICYIQCGDESDSIGLIEAEIAKLKDVNLIESPQVLYITQDRFEGYTERPHFHPAQEAAWIEIFGDSAQIEPVLAAVRRTRIIESDYVKAGVVNAHIVMNTHIIAYLEATDRDYMVPLIETIGQMSGVAEVSTSVVYMKRNLELPEGGVRGFE